MVVGWRWGCWLAWGKVLGAGYEALALGPLAPRDWWLQCEQQPLAQHMVLHTSGELEQPPCCSYIPIRKKK